VSTPRTLCLLCFSGSVLPRSPHSFPTRRSSDLGYSSLGLTVILQDRPGSEVSSGQVQRNSATTGSGGGGIALNLAGRYFTTRPRSEEHTSELQSRENLVCRLLLEKKKQATRQLT